MYRAEIGLSPYNILIVYGWLWNVEYPPSPYTFTGMMQSYCFVFVNV